MRVALSILRFILVAIFIYSMVLPIAFYQGPNQVFSPVETGLGYSQKAFFLSISNGVTQPRVFALFTLPTLSIYISMLSFLFFLRPAPLSITVMIFLASMAAMLGVLFPYGPLLAGITYSGNFWFWGGPIVLMAGVNLIELIVSANQHVQRS